MTPRRTSGRSLIIGGRGQVGWHIGALLGDGRSIVTSRAGARGAVRLDLASLAERPMEARMLLQELAPEAVYCAGGMTDVEFCESNSKAAARTNCDGPAALAAAAGEQGVPFVYFSTEYVFNGRGGPYSEESSADPISAYGESKWRGERLVSERHPWPLIVRTTVVYGFDPGEKNFLYSLRRELQAGRTFRVPKDQISTPTYNRDLAAAVVGLVAARRSGLYHVCGPERLSRYDFAVQAAADMGMDAERICGVPTSELRQRAARPLNAGLTTAKLMTAEPGCKLRRVSEAIRDWISGGLHPWAAGAAAVACLEPAGGGR